MFPRTSARPRGLPPIGSSRKSPDPAAVPASQGSYPALRPAGSQAAPGPAALTALTLPDPGHGRLGRLAWRLVLAITPVAARALFVFRSPARRTDHEAIIQGTWRSMPSRLSRSACLSRAAGMAASGVSRAGRTLTRRWHGASCGAVRRPSPPHSGHPRCRTFPAVKRHR